jgi:O-acetylserine/cysteine efflux transporter
VSPLSLLIPVFGITSSMLILDERISTPNLISIGIIIVGLAVGLYRRPANLAPVESQPIVHMDR